MRSTRPFRCGPWERLTAVAALGVLGLPGVVRADHPADTAGGLWPLASLLVFALGFVVAWAASAFLERRERPRSKRDQ